MNDRNNTEFFNLDFYKEALMFCNSYVGRTGGNEEEAKDVLQDAIERLLTKLKDRKFQFQYKPKQLLYAIIKNTWKEYLRNKKKRSQENVFHKEPIDEERTVIEEKIQSEKYHVVFDRCFKLLSPACIEAFNMEENGLSFEKMTKKLGLSSTGILRDRLYRCRQRLKILMTRDKDYYELLKDG